MTGSMMPMIAAAAAVVHTVDVVVKHRRPARHPRAHVAAAVRTVAVKCRFPRHLTVRAEAEGAKKGGREVQERRRLVVQQREPGADTTSKIARMVGRGATPARCGGTAVEGDRLSATEHPGMVK